MNLEFTYWEYCRQMVLPFAFIFLGGIITFILAVWKYMARRGTRELRNLLFPCVILISVVILGWHRIPMKWKFICDAGKETCAAQGTVESIERDRYSERYSYNGNPCRASWIEVDGKEYYIMTAEPLHVGAEVEISYLPKSKVVLTCEIVEEAEDE